MGTKKRWREKSIDLGVEKTVQMFMQPNDIFKNGNEVGC